MKVDYIKKKFIFSISNTIDFIYIFVIIFSSSLDLISNVRFPLL